MDGTSEKRVHDSLRPGAIVLVSWIYVSNAAGNGLAPLGAMPFREAVLTFGNTVVYLFLGFSELFSWCSNYGTFNMYIYCPINIVTNIQTDMQAGRHVVSWGCLVLYIADYLCQSGLWLFTQEIKGDYSLYTFHLISVDISYQVIASISYHQYISPHQCRYFISVYIYFISFLLASISYHQ